MSQVSLTITGSIEEVEHVLKQLRAGAQPTAARSENASKSPGDLTEFVRSLDAGSLRVLLFLADSPETEYTAGEFADRLSLDRQEFFGFVGVIGRTWKKAFPSTANPFASRRSRDKNEAVWLVSESFAAELKTAAA